MKLIDLLVQELPKQGGWPTASEGLALPLAGNDLVTSWRFNSELERFVTCTYGSEVVTREEYEAAIAASQQSAWNADGLPPVGCECEYTMNGGETWWKCTIKYIVGCSGLVMACDCPGGEQYVHFESYNRKKQQLKFRPIRTEAERKREEAKNVIAELCRSSASNGHSAELIYDAIAAGKIPNITLK